eukprot:CAMPEP_0116829148 /NCGR_PEP_ID=MMETSP0418-20121206/4038_1 /TAXON_ID=1158023 /ORGANISM="Astrosyne radiata, Strain 13vi08-1A" /LENGTH=229 /DNA_ID=CAMNT_0004458091 /DNA_START=69 /DNA_END=758 /DNA_ORIENTATION=+
MTRKFFPLTMLFSLFFSSIVLRTSFANEFVPPRHMQTHPLLQIPCGLSMDISDESLPTPVASFVDTGAQVSVLSYQAAQRAGLMTLLDRRYAGHALGVGHCRVLGRIPAGAVILKVHGHRIPAPSLTILESTNEGVDLLLGLDFLRDYKATLSLKEEEILTVTVQDKDIRIPFLRPRASLFSFEEEKGDDPKQDCLRGGRLCEDDILQDECDETNNEDDGGPSIDMSGV